MSISNFSNSYQSLLDVIDKVQPSNTNKPKMKLSSFQIEALVSKIMQHNADQIKKQFKALLQDKKLKMQAKKYASLINKIPKKVRKLANLNEYNEAYFVDRLADRSKLKIKRLDRNKVKGEVILASIDSSDLSELRNKLNYKF